MSGLKEMPVSHIVTWWRPGSQDWTWLDEINDLTSRALNHLNALREKVMADGFDFANEDAPVILGSDGRVWDGHHRIVIAVLEGIPTLNCKVIGSIRPQNNSEVGQ